MSDRTPERGYVPGLLGGIAGLHARYYARHHGFGAAFEVAVAQGLADFLPRLEHGPNAIWHVTEHGRTLASIAIDGEDLGQGLAHLRWFVVAEPLQGQGVGRQLLDAALAFVDARGFAATRLWTFRGLDVARHLYEARGFRLESSGPGASWGVVVEEQCFFRPTPLEI